MIKVGVAGSGRMGQSLFAAVAAADDMELAAVWVREKAKRGLDSLSPTVNVSADITDVLHSCDVLLDFSLPEGSAIIAAALCGFGTPLVSGVSGLDSDQMDALSEAARETPVFYDRNMSLGVAVMSELVTVAAATLRDEFTAEVHETHHVHKLDAPSGTALQLGEALAAARHTDAARVHYEVVRRGEVPGDHSVIFSNETEKLTLEHSVTTRDVFARGALRAARWVLGKPPGLYRMADLVRDRLK